MGQLGALAGFRVIYWLRLAMPGDGEANPVTRVVAADALPLDLPLGRVAVLLLRAFTPGERGDIVRVDVDNLLDRARSGRL
jgi:hypothetical protein